jgi:hypothetical protein
LNSIHNIGGAQGLNGALQAGVMGGVQPRFETVRRREYGCNVVTVGKKA